MAFRIHNFPPEAVSLSTYHKKNYDIHDEKCHFQYLTYQSLFSSKEYGYLSFIRVIHQLVDVKLNEHLLW
ncbi:unnamed protein product [Heterobilharzia americana]|nr:unnamed protein product [Heterobilharzia americana]CAH8574710.1 unnamed protein product [Heterobilharzia americana]